jgi:hypothetical protein
MGEAMNTEAIDKLYLELSHFTSARNFREIAMRKALIRVWNEHNLQFDDDVAGLVNNAIEIGK